MSENLPEVVDSKPVVFIPDIDTLTNTLEAVERAKKEVLKEGLDADFAEIPGTNRPCLLKPGAEKLCQLFGYRVGAMQMLSEDKDGDNNKKYGAMYKCTLVDSHGRVVGECDGYAYGGERKARSWDRNTIIKMAQKRAFVGAVLWATASSGLFTQDIEDQAVGETRNETTEVSPRKTATANGKEKVDRLIVYWSEKNPNQDEAVTKEQVFTAVKGCGFQKPSDLGENSNAESLVKAYLNAENNDDKETAQKELLACAVDIAKEYGWSEERMHDFLVERGVTQEDMITGEILAELEKVVKGE